MTTASVFSSSLLDARVPKTISLGPIAARVFCGDGIQPFLGPFVPIHKTESLQIGIDIHVKVSAAPWPAHHQTSRKGNLFVIQTPFYRGTYTPGDGIANMELAPPDKHLETHERRLYGALRMLLSLYLLEQGGAALHGCALGAHGKAHAFLGKSGAGKTTLARMSSDKILLGDDLVAILPDEAGLLWVYGTPFSGREGMKSSMTRLPLTTLSALFQGTETRIEKMDVPEAMKAVLAHLFIFDGSGKTRERALAISQRMISLATPLKTWIQLDSSPWELGALQ